MVAAAIVFGDEHGMTDLWRDDGWKFKDGHVMLTNGIDSRSGNDVVLENDGGFDGVLGAMGFGNLHHVELLQKPDANQGCGLGRFGCYWSIKYGLVCFVADFEVEWRRKRSRTSSSRRKRE
ncbi:hypothetical protein F0562_017921 [Nyssa sinensis]|uniref:Uncharacterized protein n=1 Tax=Nyssa sinensis TaxID=561372 RepID=A0A5J4ZAL4_9ASTE|nr:hypothetical protein F0562_017921 [Nyssa sinensis]